MYFLRRIVLLCFCVIVLAAEQAISQDEQSASLYPCKNQFEVDYIGYERIRGPVAATDVERETLVSEGHVLFTNKDKPYIFASYKYDRSGQLTEKNFYRLDGVAMPKTTYDYDSNGRLLKENHFSAVSKKPYLETNYTYENERLKESVGRSIEDGGFLSKQVFSYDKSKNYFEFVETKVYKSPTIRIGFKQDEKCRLAETFVYTTDGKLDSKSVITFDEFDNPASIIYFSGEGELLGKRKYEYKYDGLGNWVEQRDFSWLAENGKSNWVLVEIGYRKIKYFEKVK